MSMRLWDWLRNRWAAFLHDLLWVPVAVVLAYWLRFNLDQIPVAYRVGMYWMIALALPVQALLFWMFGLYRGLWRFASVPDHIRILKTAGLGALTLTLVLFVAFRLETVPRSVLLLYPLLLVLGLATPRVFYRWVKDHRLGIGRGRGQRALIVGAGRAGELLASDLARDFAYQAVAFADDDPRKRGKDVHGVRVMGALADIPQLIARMDIAVVLVAMPSVDSGVLDRVVEMCAGAKVPCRTLPSLLELADGAVQVARLRPVTVEDLLDRQPIELDSDAIRGYLAGKSVLVTGAGGSIGAELCRQIARKDPRELIVLDSCEYNLFRIENILQAEVPELKLHVMLRDVCNPVCVHQTFGALRPQVVFHAAALKHVPLVERNAAEGANTNALGTRHVAEAAERCGCERFVLISTDKAVNPANVMGATKRVAEIYCQHLDLSSSTRFITTRFGNVLDSKGSVVPLFQQQIAAGGPVTVTHPEITRYFMTIPEAVGLILQAGAMGRGGEIFVLDMGKPVPILHLAEQMIRLSGKTPGEDVKIAFIGLRPGEKLFEELFHELEGHHPTDHSKIMLARRPREEDWQRFEAKLSELNLACRRYDEARVRALLAELVPEYARQLRNDCARRYGEAAV